MLNRFRAFWTPMRLLLTIAVLTTIIVGTSIAVAHVQVGTPAADAFPGEDWPMFLHDPAHSAASHETTLGPDSIAHLTRHWIFPTDQQRQQEKPLGAFASSPTVVGDTVYVGSWDGYEYALDRQQGYMKWRTFLGQTYNKICDPPTIGITSSAAVANDVVYVGGGDDYWYALDAKTGAIQWKVYIGNSQNGSHYNWASPLLVNGFAYIGVASNCDAPLVQGQLIKVDLAKHSISQTLNMVPNGQVGGGIWTSPAIDTATQTIFVTTGTINDSTQVNAQAIVAINANTMQIKSAWQVPSDETGEDSDWGDSPTLMVDKNGRQLVAGINKNGVLYAFDRNNISAGPIWERQIAFPGACPPCGEGSIVSSVFVNSTLYVGGGNTLIKDHGYDGAIRAIDPATGSYLWEHGTLAPVYPALAYVNGLIIDGAGSTMEILDAHTGNRLYGYETGNLLYGAPTVAYGQIYLPSTDGTVMAFGLGKTTQAVADPHCQSGWTCQDIATPDIDGSESFSKDIWDVNGAGTGIGGDSDQFRFIAQRANGDFTLTAQVTTDVGQHIQAGLMVRQSADPGSPYYAALLNGDQGFVVQYRTGLRGASTITGRVAAKGDRYVAIQRIGDQFQAATSPDGQTYTLIPGSTFQLALPAAPQVGLAVSSMDKAQVAHAAFNGVKLVATAIPLNIPPESAPCPAGWTCEDAGNPALLGSQSVTGNVWSVQAAGKDIWRDSDQFRYIWQPITQDGTVTAHVTALADVHQLVKAGVMIRQGSSSTAPYYGAFVTPQGLVIQYRPVGDLRTYIINDPDPNTLADTQKALAAVTAPVYLRVARWQNILTAYTSPDGQNWTVVANSSIALKMTGAITGGIAVTSHDAATLATVTFDNVAVTQSADRAPTACPNSWTCEDIGHPDPVGNQQLTGSTWTIQSSGIEIYHRHDSFHYVSQPATGDVDMSAQVIRMDFDPNVPNVQAGLMLRTADTPTAPYYAILVKPGNSVHVQYRRHDGDDTGEAVTPTNGTPIFVRIVRHGNQFSGYTSIDDNAWQLVPGSTVTLALPPTLLAGIAVTSHDNGLIATVTFDSLAIHP